MDSNAALDILKLAVPAALAWGAAWLTNRRERRAWIEKQEAQQQELLVKQGDRLATGWAEMTAQAREIIRTMQVETIEAKTALAACVGERAQLLSELVAIKAKYETALRELETLSGRTPNPKRRRGRDNSEPPP